MKHYEYEIHNPQAIKVNDLFIRYPYKLRRSVYRLPYKKRFTKEETRDYIYSEFMRQVLLDVIENNTVFVYNDIGRCTISIMKNEVKGELFEKLYREGRFDLDYLKSNFMGHFIMLYIDRIDNGKRMYKYVFLSGDLKTKRDKASEIW